ncbi:hypothetical protein [Plantactinospora sp. CA-290183]|uniref:hypothetical protein n=1 Tax=Plantactinospora sp. CA-290183 TaxID=3240006 RepID=UPI003D911317
MGPGSWIAVVAFQARKWPRLAGGAEPRAAGAGAADGRGRAGQTGLLVHDPSDVVWIAKVWESVKTEALPHQQSIELISGVAEQWS